MKPIGFMGVACTRNTFAVLTGGQVRNDTAAHSVPTQQGYTFATVQKIAYF
jgi:hypothetical protein